jgi:hypothetical protein
MYVWGHVGLWWLWMEIDELDVQDYPYISVQNWKFREAYE